MTRMRYIFLSAIMSLMAFAAMAQSTITITTTAGLCCATEKWVSITTMANGGGTQIWGQGDGTYGNGQGLLTNESISLAPGTYYVNCYDRYDDTWDGGLIDVVAYGVSIGNNGGVTPDDGNDVDATSAWETPADELEASFQIIVPAPPSCLPPSNLSVSNLTAVNADLGWTENGTATSWEIEYGPIGFMPGMGVGTATAVVSSTNPYNASSLTSNTGYDFYVRAICSAGDTSVWSPAGSFTTLCGVFSLPQLEDFASGFLPNSCWNEATSGTPATGPSSFGSGAWTEDGFANNGATGAVKINLYFFNDVEDWILTPEYDLTGGTNYSVDFDFGIFTWNTTTPGTLGSDDEVQVLISTNGGTSWTNLATYNSTYVTNPGGNQESIDITSYANSTVQFAIWATDGAVDDLEDNDVFLDNFRVREVVPNDVGVTGITAGNCSTAETVTVDITNFGTATQTSFPVSYSVNGSTAITETWTGSLASGMTMQYTFGPTFDASATGNYVIIASTALSTDAVTTNDGSTFTVVTDTVYSTTYTEDFEAANPADLTYDGTRSDNAHGLTDYAIYDNLYSSDVTFTVDLPKIAPIATGDIMEFEYRYTDFSGGGATTLGAGDTLKVQVSTDCGATYTTINSINAGNHTATTQFTRISTDLSAYAGQTVKPRVLVEWGTGDYYIDLDSFYIGVAPLAVTVSVTSNFNGADISCNGGADGSAVVIPIGGTGPYTFLWDANANNQTIATATGLMAGTYTVTVTDANSMTTTGSVTITEPTILIPNIVQGDVSCNGGNDGSAMITPLGGTGGYTFLWDANANNQTTAMAINLVAGTYDVTITDANNCTVTTFAVISEPTALVLTTASIADTNNLAIGAVGVVASGGTAPYTYQWDANTGNVTTDTVSGLASGMYAVTVTDNNGCSEVATVSVDSIFTSTITLDYVQDLKVFPNPSAGYATIQVNMSRHADLNVKIYNLTGQVVQDLGNRYTTNEEIKVDLSNYPNGVYLVRFIIDEEVITRKLILSK